MSSQLVLDLRYPPEGIFELIAVVFFDLEDIAVHDSLQSALSMRSEAGILSAHDVTAERALSLLTH